MINKAKYTYRGNVVDHYVTLVTGDHAQAWTSTETLWCGNDHCRAEIPAGTLFTRRAFKYFTTIWQVRKAQPFCKKCVPFYENYRTVEYVSKQLAEYDKAYHAALLAGDTPNYAKYLLDQVQGLERELEDVSNA